MMMFNVYYDDTNDLSQIGVFINIFTHSFVSLSLFISLIFLLVVLCVLHGFCYLMCIFSVVPMLVCLPLTAFMKKYLIENLENKKILVLFYADNESCFDETAEQHSSIPNKFHSLAFSVPGRLLYSCLVPPDENTNYQTGTDYICVFSSSNPRHHPRDHDHYNHDDHDLQG